MPFYTNLSQIINHSLQSGMRNNEEQECKTRYIGNGLFTPKQKWAEKSLGKDMKSHHERECVWYTYGESMVCVFIFCMWHAFSFW